MKTDKTNEMISEERKKKSGIARQTSAKKFSGLLPNPCILAFML